MKKSANTTTRNRVVFSLVVLGLIAAVIVLPNQFRSKAVSGGQDVSDRTVSEVKGLEYYDIRTDKNQAETLINFRQTAGRDAVSVADARDKFVIGEDALRASVPTLKVEYNEDIRTPEVIAPDVNRGSAVLTGPSSAKHSDILRRFAADNGTLIGLRGGQAAQLKVTADYTNPDGNLSYAHLEQFINDVPVFRGEIKAGFSKRGEMFRVVNNLAPDLDYNSVSTEFGDPLEAVRVASNNINFELKAADLVRNETASNNLKTVFGSGDWATTAEKMYFPTEPGVARAAWRVLIWEPVNAFYVIVDAQTGTVLWRKNLTNEQTQAATYNVYANPLSPINVAESPAPITPGPTNPATGTQGTQITRTNVTLIGNEGDLSFNNLGWITDGANGVNGWTDGNNVEAGLDLGTPNGVDAPVSGTNRVFNFTYNPAPGLPAPPDDITTTAFRNGAVTQLFYINNRFHDELYKVGFTEAARNYQNDNFGRGGLANDRVSAEAQDSSGTNNANFSIAADGVRGRMQMYRFTQTPARDGDLDADIVIHEYTHGLSQRLVGNAAGLTNNSGRSMGEGWSDFYALATLSQESDPANGIYAAGAYATLNVFGIGTTNSYYGIRRFPYAVLSSTGGPNNRPHNPLTYADINNGCVINDGAYAPSAPFAGNACSEVHNAGEVWTSALWEVRARLIQRLGFAAGNRRILQLTTDGMKLTPNAPTFVAARNGIIQAAQNSGVAADVADVREGFRIRGLGFTASETAGGVATEAFDQANVLLATGFSVSDAPGDNDGFPEPGENVVLTVPITNTTGATVNNVAANVTGGGSADYGSIANGETVNRQINYTIPAATPCGSLLTITINITSANGSRTETQSVRIGKPNFSGTTQNFDGVTAPALPTGWSQVNSGAITGWVTNTATAVSAPNSAFAPTPATPGEASLITTVNVTSASAQLAFRTFYLTESAYDGMVLEIQTGNGAYQDITAAGGSFVSGGYNITMNASSPFPGRQAWSGTSTGFLNTVVNLPAAANGQRINVRWRTASDVSVTPAGTPGTRIDDVAITGGAFLSGYECSLVAPTSRARADFDGDGRTDLSVFRPTNGTWYLNRSSAGFSAVTFGLNGDKLTPGDFDGDGKTDTAVARANSANTGLVFYVFNSLSSTVSSVQFGLPNDVPVVGDYDNDGKANVAVFRPSNGTWYILNAGGGSTAIQFGQNGDVPVQGDYDGDGRTDAAVVRGNVWYINKSTGGVQTTQFGLSSDNAVPADYDGNGTTDIAVFRASTGTWYTSLNAAINYGAVQFGNASDVPVPGDYDGDGRADIAVFRGGTWYIRSLTGGFTTTSFGVSGDAPIPKQYIP